MFGGQSKPPSSHHPYRVSPCLPDVCVLSVKRLRGGDYWLSRWEWLIPVDSPVVSRNGRIVRAVTVPMKSTKSTWTRTLYFLGDPLCVPCPFFLSRLVVLRVSVRSVAFVTGSNTPAIRLSLVKVVGLCNRMWVRKVSCVNPAMITTNSDSVGPVLTRRASWVLISTNSVNDCFGICRVETMSARKLDWISELLKFSKNSP